MNLYIASQDASGGILRCRLTGSGQMEFLEKYEIDRPAFLNTDGQKLYALLREPFLFQSGVAEFDILPDGSLRQNGDIQPVFGTISAFLLPHRGRLYSANYCSSNTSRLPDRVVPHPGRSIDPNRQTCSHPHCITATPDGDFLCICDLGTDCIYVCDPDLNQVSRVEVTPGSGPRHLIFSHDGRFAYVSNEMGNTVSVFAYESGKLTHLKDLPTVPEDFDGISTACADACPLGAISKTETEEITVCGKTFVVGKVDYSKCIVCQNGACVNRFSATARPDRIAALCNRTCMVGLEERGALTKGFENKFRNREVWSIGGSLQGLDRSDEQNNVLGGSFSKTGKRGH